ncbi:MAG: alanyl-tRNA editing protein [Candidatus Bathyarchaeia archaeon]|jgi:Ser-tRNA(Ala) deacylase AlaX
MTRKLFWEDAYIREFDATVSSVDGNQVVLDQTAFNPRGGGLVGDLGTLDGVRVLDTIKASADSIVHVLEGTHSLAAGNTVHGVLDWNRRYRIMRMHTSAHLLSAIFNKETGALITGNQIEPDKSRIDFSLNDFDREKMLVYCSQANEAIANNPLVKTYFMKREEALKIPGITKLASVMPPDVKDLRIVEIEGYDLQADGGVHVKNLGEVGKIEPLKFENKGKSNRRMYFAIP